MTIAVITAFLSLPTFASGTGGSGGGSADFLYESGKAKIKNTVIDGVRHQYCVKSDDAVNRISTSALQPFKFTDAATLKQHIVSCDAPDQTILEQLSRYNAMAVVHYLNKRYRLALNF